MYDSPREECILVVVSKSHDLSGCKGVISR